LISERVWRENIPRDKAVNGITPVVKDHE
jgi:hypothetical protein